MLPRFVLLRTQPCFSKADAEDAMCVITTGVLCREFLGRSSELSYLLDRAFGRRPPSGSGVIVRGSAGIGKSRLIAEFASSARADGARVGIGHAREFANAPYAAIEEALHELGVDFDARQLGDIGKAQRFAAVLDAIADKSSDATQRIVIVEDVHWADGGTVELLRFLAAKLPPRSVLVIATYRTEDVDANSSRASAVAVLEREFGDVITLEPLPPPIINQLLAEALSEVRRTVATPTLIRVAELSDGRPLFAEELLRGVLERLDRDNGTEPSVPPSIRASVRERFASMTEPDRDVLLHAAIVGRRFSARFVTALLDRPAASVFAALRRSRDLQLIVEDDDEEGDLFAFRHSLTREAIYAELLRAEARVLHARVAQQLTAMQEVDVSAVAEHAWRGGDPSAPEWNERAGIVAGSVHAYADAALNYERAFRLTREPAKRASLAERVAEALYALGDVEHSAEWYGSAADAHDEAGNMRPAWRIRLRHARVLVEAGKYEEGIRAAHTVSASRDGADPELRFEADVIVAGLISVAGYPEQALERLTHAATIGARPDLTTSGHYSGALALALGFVGRADESRIHYERALSIAREIDSADLCVRTLNNWGTLELAYGDLARSLALLQEALGIAERTKNRRNVAWQATNAGVASLLSGNLGQAEIFARKAREIEHGVTRVREWSLALDLRLAQLTAVPHAGLRERVIAEFERALEGNDLESGALLAAVSAFSLAADGRLAEASHVVGRIVAVLDTVVAPYWIIDAATRYGEPAVRQRTSELIAAVASRDSAWPARAWSALAGARNASRSRRREDGIRNAEQATELFRKAGWTFDACYALEAAGRTAEALAAFREAGAHAEVRRLSTLAAAPGRRRGEATLTQREREIASLVASGRSAKSIAEMLVISERTVETHVASIYRKLGVTSRGDLVSLLARTTAPTSS
jgi:DNA-binding CsgD family transcriptional regulator